MWPAPNANSIFYLNAKGASNRYQILRFTADGLAVPPKPVIGPHNDGHAAHVAWPSALQMPNGKIRLYATRHDDSHWNDVCLWESVNGVDFEFIRPVLGATVDRGRAVARSRVYFVSGSPRPFKMVYADAEHPVAKQINIATSPDGLEWKRDGIVCTASECWDAAGLSPIFVTQARHGMWVLFYQAFETLRKGHAVMAVGSSPDGPFEQKTVILSPIESSATVSNVRRSSDWATIQGEVRLREPYVLRSEDPPAVEPVVPIARHGDVLYFDRPLCSDFGAEAELRHIGFRKANPSFVWEAPQGWSGYWTGHGQFDSVLSEYTFAASAPRLEGPWTVQPKGIIFSPWSSEGFRSTENPVPIQVVQL